MTRRWSPRAHLCWASTTFLFVVYLAYALDWTFASHLGPASTAGGVLLWVLEVFAAVLSVAYLWEICDALGSGARCQAAGTRATTCPGRVVAGRDRRVLHLAVHVAGGRPGVGARAVREEGSLPAHPKTGEDTSWFNSLRANWAETTLALFGLAGIVAALTKANQAALLLFPTLGMAAAPYNSLAARRAALPPWLRERRRTEYRRERRVFAAGIATGGAAAVAGVAALATALMLAGHHVASPNLVGPAQGAPASTAPSPQGSGTPTSTPAPTPSSSSTSGTPTPTPTTTTPTPSPSATTTSPSGSPTITITSTPTP